MTGVQQIMEAKATMAGTLVMAQKCVTFRRHDHLVSVPFGDLLSHSYNITFSMFCILYRLNCTYIVTSDYIHKLYYDLSSLSGNQDVCTPQISVTLYYMYALNFIFKNSV